MPLQVVKQSQSLQVGNTKIRLWMCGAGSPVVLIHGLAASSAWWVRNVDALSRSHTVYLIDLPGFGSMRRYAQQFSIAGCPDWLAAVFSELNLEKAALIGHSMGGLIAANFAARFASRVSKLVLAAPAIALSHKSVPPFLLPLLQQTMNVRPAFLPTFLWDTARAGPFTLWRVANELLGMDTAADLKTIKIPSLLVFGGRDPLVPASVGPSIASRLENSSLRVLRNAGHILMYDQADMFNKIVLEFLS